MSKKSEHKDKKCRDQLKQKVENYKSIKEETYNINFTWRQNKKLIRN